MLARTPTERLWQDTVVPKLAAHVDAAGPQIRGEPKWALFVDFAQALGAVTGAGALLVSILSGPALSFRFDPTTAIKIGIGAVVTLGAAGLILRGVGETAWAKQIRFNFKAWGYFLGAMAYVVTASVALSNTAGFIHLAQQ